MYSKRIVYFGDIGEPNSASAIHVRNRSEIFKSLGYKVDIVCVTPKNGEKLLSDRTVVYHYLPPIKGKGKIRGIKWNIDLLLANETFPHAKKIIGELNPDILILYEINSIILQKKFRKFSKILKYKLIIETTEWMETEKNRSISANLIIKQKDLQKKYTDQKCKNIIVISSFLEQHYKSQGCNVICLPPTFPTLIKENEVRRIKDWKKDGDIRLVFAGSVSHKDYLKEVLKALLIVNEKKIRISFDIIGPSIQEIMKLINVHDLKRFGIFVHGRLNHEDVLRIVKNMDFSVLLRQNRRYAKAGVSTKFCEAMKLGVPSICTRVNGTDLFVKNNENGFLIKDNSIDTLVEMLNNILQMREEDILKMKKSAYKYAEEIFSKEKYIDNMARFLDNCN